MIPNNRPYIIGETAFHHEGDIDFLKALVVEASRLGLDAIKFHFTVDLDSYMIADHEAINIIRPWCFNRSEWDEVLSVATELDIIALCNDVSSVKYAIENQDKIKAIEIHATGLNDVFLLTEAAQFSETIVLGTGGSTLDEIEYAITYLNKLGKTDLFLMHGFQNYPTDYRDIKLDRMKKISGLFDLPVGYADHTDPKNPHNEYLSCLGIANGFNVLEKHFTPLYGEKRIDAQAAVSLEQLTKIKTLAEIIFQTLGAENSLELSDAERKYGNTGPMKKAIVAKRKIVKGEKITIDNILFKRTNLSSSIKQNELFKILNNNAIRDIEMDEVIDLTNVNYSFVTLDISQFKNTKE